MKHKTKQAIVAIWDAVEDRDPDSSTAQLLANTAILATEKLGFLVDESDVGVAFRSLLKRRDQKAEAEALQELRHRASRKAR